MSLCLECKGVISDNIFIICDLEAKMFKESITLVSHIEASHVLNNYKNTSWIISLVSVL